MMRLRYILTMTLLAVAFAATGQNYVVDEVCAGTERVYRVNGETGSSYAWMLEDAAGNLIQNNIPAAGFTDSDPDTGEAIQGSEVRISWNQPGNFILSVIQTSVHGCDSLQLGQVNVTEQPLAFAGNDQTICPGEEIRLFAATASNYGSLLWTTNGDGRFDNPTALRPLYLPGVNDLRNGYVQLTLTATGLLADGGCEPVVSTLSVHIIREDELEEYLDLTVCETDLPFVWRDRAIYQAGYYEEEYTSPDGCEAFAALHLEVVPDNEPPVAENDHYIVEMNVSTPLPVLVNDYDPNGQLDPYTIEIVEYPRHGTLTINENNELVYTPHSNFLGKDQFTYSVCDDGIPCNMYCDDAFVNIDVLPNGESDECAFFIPEGFSPNNDGVHDYFFIWCINRYPDAKLMIFDKQGYLLYQKEKYGNMGYWGTYEDAHWNGETVKHHQNAQHKIEPGVYMYILDKGNGELARGFVMVSY
ncbi:Ig-like domain-containing protein [Gaoshiqia sp. Z1-71]|uniref:Ig-like domain-containing protein n=1 Tax=Gaoshiqia hydrogeniformans TaxID=3290090 RepID=UPI003BF77B47